MKTQVSVIIFSSLSLVLLMGCYKNSSQKQSDSGIEGQVRLGPLSGMVSSKNPINDKPYQATLTILNQDREEVTQIETDSEGNFKIALKPGEYIISPMAPNPPNPPHPEEEKVTVKPNEFTKVTVRFDTGIR